MLQLQTYMFHAQRSKVPGVCINEDSFEIGGNYTNDYDAIKHLAQERTRAHKLKERIWRDTERSLLKQPTKVRTTRTINNGKRYREAIKFEAARVSVRF